MVPSLWLHGTYNSSSQQRQDRRSQCELLLWVDGWVAMAWS
jgi:hypothetical protein